MSKMYSKQGTLDLLVSNLMFIGEGAGGGEEGGAGEGSFYTLAYNNRLFTLHPFYFFSVSISDKTMKKLENWTKLISGYYVRKIKLNEAENLMSKFHKCVGIWCWTRIESASLGRCSEIFWLQNKSLSQA